MPSQFTVLYDASVFYPAPLRDLLMELATAGLFRAKWSKCIQEEWIESLLRKRPDLNIENGLSAPRKLQTSLFLTAW